MKDNDDIEIRVDPVTASASVGEATIARRYSNLLPLVTELQETLTDVFYSTNDGSVPGMAVLQERIDKVLLPHEGRVVERELEFLEREAATRDSLDRWSPRLCADARDYMSLTVRALKCPDMCPKCVGAARVSLVGIASTLVASPSSSESLSVSDAAIWLEWNMKKHRCPPNKDMDRHLQDISSHISKLVPQGRLRDNSKKGLLRRILLWSLEEYRRSAFEDHCSKQ